MSWLSDETILSRRLDCFGLADKRWVMKNISISGMFFVLESRKFELGGHGISGAFWNESMTKRRNNIAASFSLLLSEDASSKATSPANPVSIPLEYTRSLQ